MKRRRQFHHFSDGFGRNTIIDWQDFCTAIDAGTDLGGETKAHALAGQAIACGVNATIPIGINTNSPTGVTSGLDAGDFLFA